MKYGKLHTILPFFFWAILSVPAWAQVLSFDECLQRAAQNSYEVEAAQFTVKAKSKQFLGEVTKAFPRFSTQLGFERHTLPAYGFTQRWAFLQGDWAAGNWLFKPYLAAGKEAQAAERLARWSRLKAMAEAADLYIAVLQNEKERYLLNERLRLLSLHKQVAFALWQAGSRTELDVLQTKAEMLRLKENLSTVRQQEDVLRSVLRTILRLTAGDSLQLMALNTAKICSKPIPPLSGHELLANPRLQALQLQAQAQRQAVAAVNARLTPRLQLTGGFFWDQDPTGDGNYWLLGAGLSFPLFQWNATTYRKQQARLKARSVKNKGLAWQRELRIRLQKIHSSLGRLKHVMALQDERLAVQARAFALARANYKAGLITNLEYLNAQQGLTEIKIRRQKTALQYVLLLVRFYLLIDRPQDLFRELR